MLNGVRRVTGGEASAYHELVARFENVHRGGQEGLADAAHKHGDGDSVVET